MSNTQYLLPAGVLVSMFGMLCYMMASLFQKWSVGNPAADPPVAPIDLSQHDRAAHTVGVSLFFIGWLLILLHFSMHKA